MNARWTASLVACAAVLLWGALRATAAEPNLSQNQPATQSSAAIIQNSTLMGTMVLDPQIGKLGRIKDLLFDSRTGQATFVVLDAEIPGAGHAVRVVPYQALRVGLNPTDHRLSVALDLRPDQLRIAPQIQSNQWQMLQNPQFLQQARDFYQIKAYYAARPIDNVSMSPPPSAPSPPIQYVVPQTYVAPPSCTTSADAWAGDSAMEEFSEE